MQQMLTDAQPQHASVLRKLQEYETEANKYKQDNAQLQTTLQVQYDRMGFLQQEADRHKNDTMILRREVDTINEKYNSASKQTTRHNKS